MATKKVLKAACFCGAVQLAVTGSPKIMGYCHCESCRAWSAGPINAFSLWDTKNIAVKKGAEKLDSFRKTEGTHRKFCKLCGGHVMTVHPFMDLIDVYAPLLPELRFKPKLHVFYAEKTLRMRDGLPKFRDTPKEMGGSGRLMAE
ncbi:MAG: GFA family protein [Alphaproteobacteria bacterium]